MAFWWAMMICIRNDEQWNFEWVTNKWEVLEKLPFEFCSIVYYFVLLCTMVKQLLFPSSETIASDACLFFLYPMEIKVVCGFIPTKKRTVVRDRKGRWWINEKNTNLMIPRDDFDNVRFLWQRLFHFPRLISGERGFVSYANQIVQQHMVWLAIRCCMFVFSHTLSSTVLHWLYHTIYINSRFDNCHSNFQNLNSFIVSNVQLFDF